jgi:hypothetical protein
MEQGIRAPGSPARLGIALRNPRVYISSSSLVQHPVFRLSTASTQFNVANMRVSAVVLTFASILSLGAAQSAIVKDDRINMSCGFAQDKTGMLQFPYCCRDLQPLRGNSKGNSAKDCTFL